MYDRVSDFRFLGEYAFEGSELIDSDNAVPRRRDGTGLAGAAFFQWVNPKAWLVCVGAISTYLSPGEDLVVQATAFAMVFNDAIASHEGMNLTAAVYGSLVVSNRRFTESGRW